MMLVRHNIRGTVLEIYSGDSSRAGSTYDFEEVGFSRRVANAFIRAFIALQGANTLESQRANWIQVKRFGAFVMAKFGRPDILPQNCLDGFDKWMEMQGLGAGTISSTHNAILRILKWSLRNIPNVMHAKIKLYRSPYVASIKKSRENRGVIPDEGILRKALAACYKEIEEIEERISKLKQLSVTPGANKLSVILMRLLRHGGGIFPSQEQLLKIPGRRAIFASLKPYGGIRGLNNQFYLSIRDIFPFYLSILIQTSGNPQSLLNAEQDCIVPVPMRTDLERIVWSKARAGREQAPEFPKDKEWAAPNIVRRIKLLNDELRPHARSSQSNKLFLCRGRFKHPAPPSWQAIHNCFRDFRKQHHLPAFNLSSLRIAGGKLHHRAARSLTAAKRRLQHVSEATTQTYTPLTDLRSVHDRAILRFQGLLMSEAQKLKTTPTTESQSSLPTRSAETLFGFGCKDPLGGIASGSRKGDTCMSFHQCATCPGAMIVVDDPASVAKLIRSYDHLVQERDRATKEGWSRRFEVLYAPTLAILHRDILPGISSRTMEEARKMPWQHLPLLE